MTPPAPGSSVVPSKTPDERGGSFPVPIGILGVTKIATILKLKKRGRGSTNPWVGEEIRVLAWKPEELHAFLLRLSEDAGPGEQRATSGGTKV